MNIGEAAAKTQVPAKTIRYYEEIGLVRPGRDSNGYRRFRDDDVDKLMQLGRARALGFSIEDCRDLVAAWNLPAVPITRPSSRRGTSSASWIRKCGICASRKPNSSG